MAQHNIIGSSGEELAVKFLRKNGYLILATNFRSKIGEIDIIAKENDQIVFIEVKTRSSNGYGSPSEAITRKKIKSLILAAEYYLLINNLGQNYRIDAVEVLIKQGEAPLIHHIKNITV